MRSRQELKNEFRERLLSLYSEREVQRLFHIFLEHFIGRNLVFASGEARINTQENQCIMAGLARLEKGEPYQYILGEIFFDSIRLKLKPGVLIPRPETEELLDIIKKDVGITEPEAILDAGTGSGCIALALKKHFRGSRVTAVDVSPAALAIARENALLNALDVDFQQWDLLGRAFEDLPYFDLIVSNPPYIALSEKSALTTQVLDHEPDEALFVPGDDPLIFYRHIRQIAEIRLNEGGMIFLELNARYAQETQRLFTANNWQASLIEDLSGNLRFLRAWK